MDKKIITSLRRAFLFPAAVGLLLGGCVPPSLIKHDSAIEQTAQSPQPILLDSLDFSEADVHVDSAAVSRSQIDSLIVLATAACSTNSHSVADSLLKEALSYADQTMKQSAGDSSWAESYYEKIATMYTDMLPTAYLESIPENIAILVFRRQLNISLDSLSLSPRDSARLADLKCQDGVPYNVPIEWNERVQKAMYVVLNKRGRYMPRLLARANHYLPFMQKMFADSGLPTDLAYLPLIESGFNPQAYSHAHASGIWQFIPSTGRHYGMSSTYWVDERRDPIKATGAAISYLKKLYNDFGHWYLALAAYNCGENRLARAIQRAGTNDYWKLQLPRETLNYVPQYVAMLMVAKNAKCFGLDVPESDVFSRDTITVFDCMDMAKIAKGIGVKEDELAKINPHVRRWCTPPDAASVRLYLPAGKTELYNQFYAGLTDKDKVKWTRYKIQTGDNLSTIASRYGVAVSAVKSINRLHTSRIIAGKHLYIPVPADRPDLAVTSPEKNASMSSAASSAPSLPGNGYRKTTYNVRRGDTMSEIAEAHGVSIRNLCRWNDIRHASRLRSGQKLIVYVKQKSVTCTAKAAASPSGQAVAYMGPTQTYMVKKGDNLYTIAHKHGTSVNQLAALNGKTGRTITIYPGEKLAVPAPESSSTQLASAHNSGGGCTSKATYTVRKGDNLSSIAWTYSVPLSDLMACNGLTGNSILRVGAKLRIPATASSTKSSSPGKTSVVYYTVRSGDNLWTIARNFKTSVDKLCAANDLAKNTLLMPGNKLVIAQSGNL